MISTVQVECDGPGCPMCAAAGSEPPKKVYPVKAVIDGEVVNMMMSEGNYEQMLGRMRRTKPWWRKALSWLRQLLPW